MKNMPIYEALAQAFAAEGVDTHFTLMGDGNMHWATAMKNLPGMNSFFARHEHCACAMAMGYHLVTGKVGVASVTCGPGFTQVMTALAVASQGRIPLVVFAGETPINAKWYNQAIEKPPLATAAGAHYISAHSPQRMYQYVREAFHTAYHARKPVVIGVPYDLQKQPMPDLGDYQISNEVLPNAEPAFPHPRQVEQLADKLANAKCPIIVAGRGAVRSGAAAEIEQLADQAEALLATTLPARGAVYYPLVTPELRKELVLSDAALVCVVDQDHGRKATPACACVNGKPDDWEATCQPWLAPPAAAPTDPAVPTDPPPSTVGPTPPAPPS